MIPISLLTHQPLYVISVISNPARYVKRYHLYREFEKYINSSGAILYTVEIAFGDRDFEVTDCNNPRHIQLKTNTEIWNKENMINIGVSRLPHDWKYVAWIDTDVVFARPDWVNETIQQLQHYSVVQLFSHAIDLGPQYQPLRTFEGFVSCWVQNKRTPPAGTPYKVWHPGYAWATTRHAWEDMCGLIDWAIIGSADQYTAMGLIGNMGPILENRFKINCPTYVSWCLKWEERAIKHINRNIGYVDGLLLHHFHGPKRNRQYGKRNAVLTDHQFDPSIDMSRDWQGLWKLSPDKPQLRDQLRDYFRARNEDSVEL